MISETRGCRAVQKTQKNPAGHKRTMATIPTRAPMRPFNPIKCYASGKPISEKVSAPVVYYDPNTTAPILVPAVVK
jgi:hypothetical protein